MTSTTTVFTTRNDPVSLVPDLRIARHNDTGREFAFQACKRVGYHSVLEDDFYGLVASEATTVQSDGCPNHALVWTGIKRGRLIDQITRAQTADAPLGHKPGLHTKG